MLHLSRPFFCTLRCYAKMKKTIAAHFETPTPPMHPRHAAVCLSAHLHGCNIACSPYRHAYHDLFILHIECLFVSPTPISSSASKYEISALVFHSSSSFCHVFISFLLFFLFLFTVSNVSQGRPFCFSSVFHI